MEKAVFLDRDNTLIANHGDLGEAARVQLLEGVPAGLRALREAGYRLIVVSNQGGVARGRYTEEDVDAVHDRIAALVDEATESRDVINRFYYCPYHPEATLESYRRDHPWRKPSPGMLLQAARDMDVDLARSWMVGDQVRDIQAGHAAGVRTVLLTNDEPSIKEAGPTAVADTFAEAVETILRSQTQPPTRNGATAAPPSWTTPAKTLPAADRPARGAPDASHTLDGLKRAVEALTDEIRGEQLRRTEFTGFRLVAGMCQLLVVLLALLGLFGTSDVFMRWMVGAALVQMLTIAILLLDLKG